MSDRLTVRVTADSLEGALNRARGEAERYFGSRPFGVVGTTSSSAFGHSYFITEVTFESTELTPTVVDTCLDRSPVSDATCRLPLGHAGPHYHVTDRGEIVSCWPARLWPSGASRCGDVSGLDHVCDLPEGHTGRHVDSDAGASWVA